MFVITNKWLDENRTSAGGYNSPQVLALGWEDGLATPNWKSRSVGMVITDCQKKLFEVLVKYKQQGDKPTPKQKKKKKSKEGNVVQDKERLERERVLSLCCAQDIAEVPWND